MKSFIFSSKLVVVKYRIFTHARMQKNGNIYNSYNDGKGDLN